MLSATLQEPVSVEVEDEALLEVKVVAEVDEVVLVVEVEGASDLIADPLPVLREAFCLSICYRKKS